jgi:hypothetical protein
MAINVLSFYGSAGLENTGLSKRPHRVFRINDLMIDLHGERYGMINR